MIKTLIICESKYGTTKKAAETLSLILGPSKVISCSEFNEEYKKYDFFVLGSPVYMESLDEKIIRFAIENRDLLKIKKVALFCTCLAKSKSKQYFKEITSILRSECIVTAKAIGGILKLKELDKEDMELLLSFSEKTNIVLKDADFYDIKEIVELGLDIKNFRDKMIPAAPYLKIKSLLEEFLNCHNTCTLSTGFNGRVRGTPIEYTYKNGYIYLFSEGGQKFANILLNQEVSISVYDEYVNMTKLAGVQMDGKALIVEYGSKEYCDIAQMKGFKVEELLKLPIKMNIIKVKLIRAEFLYSKFKTMGYEAKQIFEFKE